MVPDLFEAVAARFPDELALEIPAAEGRARFTATYAELESRSRALGHQLVARLAQVAPEALEPVVVLWMARTCPGLLALQLACLRIGAPYLAIDPSLPDDHARFLIEDAGAELVCADAGARARAGRLARHVPLFERDWRAEVPDADSPPLAPLRPERLAYLIYTSGTTGRPKGVEIEHGSLANLVHGDLEAFDLGPGDRVAQGSSPSYDSSLEEVWMALSTGATVVVLDAETTRSGPDLIPWLRAERISVLCPPPTLLRTTGCLAPAEVLPDLRLVYVGGEALPTDLAAAWGAGRLRLVNGYGPTECTVTVLRSEVRDANDIRIGTAIPGSAAFVLHPDGDDVTAGEAGELWIAGKSLARGYRGRPDLTAERFPVHPLHGRCYRTGDLVRAGADGELRYLGRIDDQVQLRGHRVELGAVEARLCELDEVGGAACCVRQVGGRDLLVAFVVATEVAAQLDLGALRARLVALLPEPMVPARLEQVRELPTSVGGKLDRARLPALSVGGAMVGAAEGPSAVPSAARAAEELAGGLPESEVERAIGLAFAEALVLPRAPELEADFFQDLGGDSLAAALLVSALRRAHATARLAVRDLYLAPTARSLARRAVELETTPNSAREHERRAGETASRPTSAGASQRLLFTMGQVAWMALELSVATLALRFVVFELGLTLLEHVAPLWLLALFVPGLFVLALGWVPLAVGLTVGAQRLLLRRYRPGRFAAFGGWHLRHWIVTRLARRIPWGLVRGTRGTSLVLRALGARVGRGVHVHRGVDLASGGWSLLEIGSGVALEQDAALRLVDLDGGELVVGAVTLGAGASVAVRAGLGPDTSLGAGARLEALGYLESGTHVTSGERWGGTPARCLGRVEVPAVADAASDSVRGDLGILLGSLLVAWCLSLPLVGIVGIGYEFPGGGSAGSVAAGSELADALRAPSAAWVGWLWFGALLPLALVLNLFLMAVLVRLLGQRVAAAGWRFPIHGDAFGPFVALWLATGLVERAGTWLSGSLYWPPWLRLAGMQIGPGAEISTVIDVLPRDVRIGPESFFADGVYLAGARLASGQAMRGATHVGRDTFVGNHAVIPAGAQLPDDVLIGVCTVADRIEKPGAWFGQPPFELPRFPEPEFERRLTHDPSLVRRLNRLVWEAARFVLPAVGLGLGFVWFFAADSLADDLGRASATSHVAIAAATLIAGAISLLTLLALKWSLLGRVRPGKHPLWSCWCSRWDFLYVAWGFLARPALAVFDGCLLQSVLLRLFGMRIGPGVLLGGAFAQVVDPDMLHFGAGATVAGIFQAHTFEDRVLKIAPLEIGPGATLGAGALAFYGVRLEAGSRALPHGVALKGETLAAGRDYAGVPLVPRTWD